MRDYSTVSCARLLPSVVPTCSGDVQLLLPSHGHHRRAYIQTHAYMPYVPFLRTSKSSPGSKAARQLITIPIHTPLIRNTCTASIVPGAQSGTMMATHRTEREENQPPGHVSN